MAQRVKRLPAMQETQVQSLGREDPLKKEMATHSSTLACKIPWMEEPHRLPSTGSQRVGHDWVSLLLLGIMSMLRRYLAVKEKCGIWLKGKNKANRDLFMPFSHFFCYLSCISSFSWSLGEITITQVWIWRNFDDFSFCPLFCQKFSLLSQVQRIS